MDEMVVYFIMNVKQKIFVMVTIGSIILWLITVFGLGFDGQRYLGYGHSKFDLEQFFKQGKKINWLGIIAIFNIVVSVTGFFLFKDK